MKPNLVEITIINDKNYTQYSYLIDVGQNWDLSDVEDSAREVLSRHPKSWRASACWLSNLGYIGAFSGDTI